MSELEWEKKITNGEYTGHHHWEAKGWDIFTNPSVPTTLFRRRSGKYSPFTECYSVEEAKALAQRLQNVLDGNPQADVLAKVVEALEALEDDEDHEFGLYSQDNSWHTALFAAREVVQSMKEG